LSEKLLQRGWFAKTQKYFVITANVGHVDMRNPDSLNIAMIIQDGKDAYAVFMRGLSKQWSSPENINRVSPIQDREEELRVSMEEMHVSDEYKLPYDPTKRSSQYQAVKKKRDVIYYQEANILYENETGNIYTGDPNIDEKRRAVLDSWMKNKQSVID
jgi:hypothetical protein